MSINNIYSQLVIVAGVIAMLIISSNLSAFAKTVKVNGSGQGTDLTTAFNFHEGAPANSVVSTGKDNIGGTFNEQAVEEYSSTADSCTAPDGTAGTASFLVQAAAVTNYKGGQIYTSGTAATGNNACVSSTTGSFGVTATQTVIGGSGKFANASGSITYTVVGTGLAAPGSPPEALGLFGAFQYTTSGSLSF
jgi:hypothetical protein